MPLYDQIIEDVMQKITSGELQVGDMLPTEMELSDSFGVSRPTVRTALQKLASDGYINRIKGCGTFVTKPKLTQESMIFIESYHQELKNKGLKPKTEVLEFRKIAAPDIVAGKLNITADSAVIKLKRLRFAVPDYESSPVLLTTAYIPYEIVPELLNLDMEDVSLYDTLANHNITVNRVVRELEIKMLYGKNARLLDAKENSPAHFISSIGYDKNDRVIEYAESFYPSDRNKFLIIIDR